MSFEDYMASLMGEDYRLRLKSRLVFIIDYDTLETHIYNGDGKRLHLEGEIDRTKDGKAITMNIRIDLKG